MRVWSVVKHYDYPEDGYVPVGVYSSEDMAKEAVGLLGDGEYGRISVHEIDVLPEHGGRIRWHRCHDTISGWVIEVLDGPAAYIYMPYTTEKDTYPVVFVRAANYNEAKQIAEYEKKYWTEKGVYGCSLEHWQTIKDQLRVK